MTQEEFENIIPRLRPLMENVGREFFGNAIDADDVAQESMIRLWRYCMSLDAGRNLQALAIKVAKNVCIDMHKDRLRTGTLYGIETSATAPDHADDTVNAMETRQEIEKAMRHLKPREQELLRARLMENRTVDEISQSTGIGKASVKSMISMAKKKVIKELKQRRTI